MNFGRYQLESPLGAGPGGPVFRATADGAEWEVRTLGRAPASVHARVRLLALVESAAALKPAAVDWEHDPPYLAVPLTRPAWPAADRPLDAAADFIALTAKCHRLGLTLGAVGPDAVRRTADGRLVLDITGPAGETTAEGDIAALGGLLQELLADAAANGRWPGWSAVVAVMRAADPADRPLAAEVAAWFAADSQAGRDEGFVAASPSAEVFLFAKPLPTPRPELDETITPPEDLGEVGSVEAAPPAAPKTGDRLGRFRLLEVLGEGGMGVVFRAEDPADGSVVAVKVLKPQAALSEASRRRFVKEARLLAGLDTPHVTRLIVADTDGGVCYLAVEYVPGVSVGQFLKDTGKVAEPAALAMVADAARGLAVAHRLGIVHRDIKPDNLLLLPEGTPGPRVKVTDFGLARLMVQSESLDVTKAGSLLGTPRFMAPEQFSAKPADPRADVYALGATLFNLLTGQFAFPQTNLMELTKAVISEPAPAADRVNPAVSSATAELVARCLAKDPADRPADAGAFLRAVERLLNGEPTDMMAHPRGRAGGVEYVHKWDLTATPAQLWPHVSNTERLNRAIGLPAVRYEVRRDPQLGTRRFAHASVIGFKMEWEEHPFEWVEGRRMGILREFTKGPFAWMLSVVELAPRPGGGTILRHTLRAEPRGFFGRLIAPVNLGRGARRGLDAVYRRIDATLAKQGGAPQDDQFEIPTRLSRARQRRLDTRLDLLAGTGAAAEAVEMLRIYLANAPDQEVARIKPLAVARRFGVDETAMTDACLRAVREGLLELQWDVICPLCRIPSGHRDTLRDVRDHESCPTCDAAFQTDFASAVELVFRIHPDVRPVEVGTYCAGGPAHSPHVVAQVRLAPGERVEMELALSAGLYRVRGPQLPWTLEMRVADGAATAWWEIDLDSAGKEPIPALAPGSQVLVLKNGPARELIIRIERAAGRDDVLTAARALGIPAFRELFPGELLSPGQLAAASTVTLLLAQADRAEDMFRVLGEARAFQLIQAGFRVIEATVRAEGGTVVKTVGEGILASFAEVSAAVRAALKLSAAVAADPLTGNIPLRVAVHRGLAMVATVNDRLDYFGQTPKLAARLLDLAGRNQLAVTVATAGDYDVNTLFPGKSVTLSEVSREGQGAVLAYVVELEPSAARGASQ